MQVRWTGPTYDDARDEHRAWRMRKTRRGRAQRSGSPDGDVLLRRLRDAGLQGNSYRGMHLPCA